MNTKTTLLMAVVALVAAAFLFFVEKPWEAEIAAKPTSNVKPLFDPKPEVDKIEFARRDVKYVFQKQDTNWNMLEPIETLASEGEVNAMLDRVTDIKYVKEYGKDDKDRPSEKVAGLDKPLAIFKMYKGDKDQGEVKIGSRLPTGKGNYLRLGGSDKILESQTELSSAFDKKLEYLRNKRVINFDMVNVRSIKVEGMRNFELIQGNGEWFVESPSRSRGDKARIEQLARPLSNLYVQDWKDDKPVSLKPYGLDRPRLKVTVETVKNFPPRNKPGDADTKPADTQPTTEEKAFVLLIGGSTDTSSSAYFAKLESSPTIFSLAEFAFKELTPQVSDLRDKQLVKIDDTAAITRIEGDTPGGPMSLTRQDNGEWAYSTGVIADKAAVEDLLTNIKNLKATDFVEPGEAMLELDWKQPRARIALTRRGQLDPITLLVGPVTASGKMVYARSALEDAVAVIREEEAEQLLSAPVAYQDRTVMKLNRDEVNRIEVTGEGSPNVVLTKVDGRWSLAEPVQGVADDESVRNLLSDVSALRSKRVVASGEKEKYGLDKPAVALAFWTQPPAPPSTAPADEEASSGATEPAADAARKPPGKTIEEEIAQTESLLQYQREHPDEEKKELTDILRERLAELKARQAAGGDAAEAKPAVVEAAPVQPAAVTAPEVHKLFLAQRDNVTYASVDNDSTVYELENKVFEDATAEMHDRSIMKFEVGDATEAVFEHGDVKIMLRKIGNDWKYVDDPVLPIDNQKVSDVLNAFRDLRTHRYVNYAADDLAQYGLDKEVSKVVVGLSDGKKYEVLLSKTGPENDADKSRYAILAETRGVFLLKGDQAAKFEQKIEDFEKPKGAPGETPPDPAAGFN